MLETLRTGSRKEAIQKTWLTSKQKRYLKVLHQVILKHLKEVQQVFINNIDPYHGLFIYCFSTLFTENGYFCYFRIFFQNLLSTAYFFFFYLLWLGMLLCYLPQKFFFSASLSCCLSTCSVVFVYLQSLLRKLILFTLVQSFKKLKLYERFFVDCLYCRVTELL